MTRVDDKSPHRPGTCKFCGVPVARKHQVTCPWRGNGVVRPDDCVQIGGVPPLILEGDEPAQSRLALFLYTLLRNGNPGEIEGATVEAEGASLEQELISVSNPFLFSYAENIAQRLLVGSKAVEDAREIVEAFIASGVEGVEPTDAEKSVLTIKAEDWLEEFGPPKLEPPLPVQPLCVCGHRYDRHGHGSTVGGTACQHSHCKCGEFRPVEEA